MKRQLFLLFLLGISLAPSSRAWARLPRPAQSSGIVLAVGLESHTLVFRANKTQKPFVLDWDKKTEFVMDGKQVPVTELKEGMSALISYRDISFHNPRLKKVSWATAPSSK